MVLTLIASGDVSDFLDTSNLKQSIATIAGVETSLVAIHVASASVIITATIAVPNYTAAASLQRSLTSSLSTSAAASTLLRISVEAVPTVEVNINSIPPTNGIDDAVLVMIGGVLPFMLICSGIFIYTIYYKRHTHAREDSIAPS